MQSDAAAALSTACDMFLAILVYCIFWLPALMRKVHVALVVCTVPATALQHRNWPERQNSVRGTIAAC